MHPNAIHALSQELPKGVYFDLEREIWLLRSTIAYHDEFGYYPFDSIEAREDFCEKWVKMTKGEYCTESFNLRKKYEQRLKKKFQDLTPREQEALDIGNKIWGSRDAPVLVPNVYSEEVFNENLERELWILRSIVEYHNACEVYPYDTIEATEDFSKNWVQMNSDNYLTEFFNMKGKYEMRLTKNYQDLVPREQEVLEMGNKIWNNRYAPSILSLRAPHNNAREEEGQDHHRDSMHSSEGYLSLEGRSSSDGEDSVNQSPCKEVENDIVMA